MAFKGWDCPLTADHVGLQSCVVCPFPCMELPMIFAMWQDPREYREDRHSVTSMTKPTKALVLEALNDYWVSPFSMVRMTFGSIFHLIMEMQREKMAAFNRLDQDFEFERKFEVPLDIDGTPATLVGKADQYRKSFRRLTDYKAAGTFSYEKAVKGDYSGYEIQLNLYRRHLYPDAESMQLSFWLTDYTKRQYVKGYRPVEAVEVPKIPDFVLDQIVADKIRAIRTGMKDPASVPPCTLEERWNGNRCERFCNAAPFCDQAGALARGSKDDE